MRNTRSGFTLVELTAMLVAGGVTVAVGAALRQPSFGKPKQTNPPGMLDALSNARAEARRLKDQAQVRGIVQSLIVWANQNGDRYPLGSAIDLQNTTVADVGRAKDTTANTFSLLCFNGSIAPELCVSPAESNPSIKVCTTYDYAKPAKAIKPADAMWDPAFSADFTKGVGNVSYAHLETSGQSREIPGKKRPEFTGRWRRWGDTMVTTEAVIGNRGPEIESVAIDGDGAFGKQYTVKAKKADSNTFKIHGTAGTWRGHIGFNDGHVELLTGLAPPSERDRRTWETYTSKDGSKRLDTILFDEPDDAGADNLFLGIFTRAGSTPKGFEAIWD